MSPRIKPDITFTLTSAEAEFFAQWCKDRKTEQEVNFRSKPPEAASILTKLRHQGYGGKAKKATPADLDEVFLESL